MKIFRVSFLIALLTSSCNCWSMDQDDLGFQPSKSLPQTLPTISSEDLEKSLDSIRKCFVQDFHTKLWKCNIEPTDSSKVRATLEDLLTHHPQHKELRLYFVRFLLNNKEHLEGLTRFSKVILSGTATNDETIEFMNSFKLIAITGKRLSPYIEDINEVFTNPNGFIKKNGCAAGIKNPNSQSGLKMLNEKITAALLEKATSLLGLLKMLPTHYCYDGVFQTIISTLDGHKQEATASKLTAILYTQDSKRASPLVQYTYAWRCLMKEKQYERAIPLYESILETALNDKTYCEKIPVVCNAIGALYVVTLKPLQQKKLSGFTEFEYSPEDSQKLKNAVKLLESARLSDNNLNPTLLTNISVLYLRLQQYEKALETYRVVMNTPIEKLTECNISSSTLERNYHTFLHAAGKTEELDQIYHKKIKEHFKQNTKIADFIKAAQAQAKEDQQKRKLEAQQRAEKHAQERVTHQAQSLEQEMQPESKRAVEETSPAFSEKEKVTEVVPQKKPKIKRRGVATKPSSDLESVEPVRQISVVYIDQLGLNKASQETFMEFFAPYTEGRKPKVSLGAMRAFSADLDRNKIIPQNKTQPQKTLDTNRGTSHHKWTFVPQDYGIDAQEQMAIITDLIEERPYQVDHVREIFLESRIVPRDSVLIKKLEELGYL